MNRIFDVIRHIASLDADIYYKLYRTNDEFRIYAKSNIDEYVSLFLERTFDDGVKKKQSYLENIILLTIYRLLYLRVVVNTGIKMVPTITKETYQQQFLLMVIENGVKMANITAMEIYQRLFGRMVDNIGIKTELKLDNYLFFSDIQN